MRRWNRECSAMVLINTLFLKAETEAVELTGMGDGIVKFNFATLTRRCQPGTDQMKMKMNE